MMWGGGGAAGWSTNIGGGRGGWGGRGTDNWDDEYLGKVFESAPSDELFEHPAHPYTKALLSAVPIPDPERPGSIEDVLVEGDLPDPANPPSGCRFRTRCWMAEDRCALEVPQLQPRPGVDHPCACHFASVD